MHRASWIWAAVLILGQPGLALSQAPERTIFGPAQYEHPAAGTSQAADTVAVPADVTGPFTLRIRNGAGEERVNAGWVYLNGVQVVGPVDFHPQVDELERPVPLQAGNELIVVIRGRAGTRLSLAVSGRLKPPVIDSVAPENGSAGTLVTLSGVFFDPVPASNQVAFAGANGTPVPAAVIAANASQVTVRVPELAASGPITLSNSRGTAQSTAFTLLPLNTGFTATRAGLNAPLTRLSTPVTPFVEGANPGDSFIFDLVTSPTKGRAFRDNNKLSYQATAAINDVDLFTYRATFADGSAREGTARVKAYNQGNLTACTRTSTLAQRTNVVNCAFYGEVVTRTSATGAPVTVQYIAVRPSSGAAPKAAVFLIGGGDFNLNFTGSAATGLATFIGANFLVRTAQIFADAGYLAIAMNGPSDLPTPRTIGQSDLYRTQVRHAVDILMVLGEVNTDNLDVFIAGTSRGAISAVATNLIGAGIALSSAVTRSTGVTGPLWIGDPSHPNLLPGFVARPSHVLWNTLDQCFVTVPADSQKLADDLGAAFDFVTGGLIADPTDQCGAQHLHGFYAIEPEAVGKTTAWLDGRVAALGGNKRPDAAFVLLPTAVGVPLQIDLAALTRDVDGDPLSYTLSHVGSGRGGTVTLDGATVTYTPPAGATGGTDNFVYVVTDGRGGVNAAVIRIRIGG